MPISTSVQCLWQGEALYINSPFFDPVQTGGICMYA
jgi:hypothetical protein